MKLSDVAILGIGAVAVAVALGSGAGTKVRESLSAQREGGYRITMGGGAGVTPPISNGQPGVLIVEAPQFFEPQPFEIVSREVDSGTASPIPTSQPMGAGLAGVKGSWAQPTTPQPAPAPAPSMLADIGTTIGMGVMGAFAKPATTTLRKGRETLGTRIAHGIFGLFGR
jgi:hypothetical protein